MPERRFPLAPSGLSFQVWTAIPRVVGCFLRRLAPLGATPLRDVAGVGVPCLGLLLAGSLCPTARSPLPALSALPGNGHLRLLC
jgi:hypothetical protein